MERCAASSQNVHRTEAKHKLTTDSLKIILFIQGGSLKHTTFLVSLLALFAASVCLRAQSTFGSIVGTVTDPSGGIVVKANVHVLYTDENATHLVTTDSKGNYEALNLKPGHYKVTVEHPGFEQQTVNDVLLQARQTSRVNVALSLGNVQQTVTVESQGGVIASETDTIASTYGAEKISTLPANFRASTSTSPYLLLTTLPGVQLDSGRDTYLSIQGGLPNQSESSIDGIPSQSVRQNRPLIEIFPSVEGIAEMKVSGVGNNAEYGSAGDITTITKSGTNSFHGSAVWYYQNADFDATPFGSTSKPEKEVNDYAFSAGGPVLIPKVYHGQNKTFFFADYEGLMYPRTLTTQNFVPTAAMKSGDFSHESGTIFDPITGKAFLNNIIPSGRISPIAQKIQSTFFPDPNTGSLTTTHSPNWIVNKAADIDSKQFDVRGDQYFGSKQSVFARFSLKNVTSLSPDNVLQPAQNDTQQNRSLVVSHNVTILPTLLNEFRLGYTSDSPGSNFSFDGKAFEKSLGFVGLPPTPWNGLPDISFNTSGINGLDVGRVENIEYTRTFTINNNTTWTLGQHNIKFGFDFRWYRSKTPLGFNGADNYGNSNFSGVFTGNDYADFLLGLPSQTSYGDVTHDNDGYNQRYQAYIQDSFRFSPKLTLEYGVRWDWNPPFYDKYGNIGNFDQSVPRTGKVVYPSGFGNLLAPEFEIAVNACPGTPNLPATGAGIPGVPCTPFVTNSQDHLPKGLREDHVYHFYPRVGFAYRPFADGNTVVRAGFGIYDAPLLGAVFYSLTGTAQTDNRTFTNIAPGTGAPIYSWPNMYAGGNGVSVDPYGNAYFGTANSLNLKNPYMMQWNFSVDRNLGGNTGLRVSYIGSHSVQLGFAQNLNQSAPSTTPYTDQPLSARPFPYWGEIENRDSGATASYHSLQVELNRRFQNGLSFTGAYTLASNISDNGGPHPNSFGGETGNGRIEDAYNRAANRGQVYGTRRHRFIGTAVYELPFGNGRAFLNHSNGLVNSVLGGWRLSTIFLAQSGDYETPYFSSGAGDPSGTGSGFYRDQRPDEVAGGNAVPSNQNAGDWFNRSAFECPGRTPGINQFSCNVGLGSASSPAPIGRFGNAGVGTLLGPNEISLSAGLGKSFAIGERLAIKIEGSFTNVLNHTNYADPNTNLTSSAFGVISSSIGYSQEFGGNRTGQVGVRIEF